MKKCSLINKTNRLLCAFGLLILGSLSISTLNAQATGAISGTVTDSSGAADLGV
jgi:hypothetical protein